MGAREAGQAFLQEILSKIPEDRRADVVATMEAVPELVDYVGEGALRQSDYSRHLDAVKAIEKQQTEWWNANKEFAEVGQKAKAAGFDPTKTGTPGAPALQTPSLPDDVLRRDELDQREVGYAALTTWMTTTGMKHFQDFGEVVDFAALMQDPRVKQIGLRGVYEAVTAPKYQEKQQAAQAAEVARQVEAGIAERLKTLHNPNAPTGPAPKGSPLDVLVPIDTKGAGIDEMVDAYNQALAGAR